MKIHRLHHEKPGYDMLRGMNNHTGILILAAGNSSRLGRPKQLLGFEGKNLLKRITDSTVENESHRVVVVLGAVHDSHIMAQLNHPRLHTVLNDHWQSGMASSIKTGLEAILNRYPDMEQCIISVCDQPFITAAVFEALKELAEQTGKGIITTGYAGAWGVPVLFKKGYFGELLALDNGGGAKKMIGQYLEDMVILPYEPAKVDIDTLADYARLSHQMVGVEEARMIIDHYLPESKIEKGVALRHASGYTLASQVVASLAIPQFAQSSMDGYAIRYADKDRELVVVDTIPAGRTGEKEIDVGQGMRIFTGAPLPKGADTVVMQEKIHINRSGTILIRDTELSQGDHVRPKGSEVDKGELAMQVGTYLSPAAIGYLAGIGCTQVDLFAPPRIALILTGDELRPLGTNLKLGEVYESNSLQLLAALKQFGIDKVECSHVRDEVGELKSIMRKSLENTDILLLVGGVSVGDYDFVVQAAKDCGVEQRFHRIRQKPGKPLFFGTYGEKLVFGLPGNPSSALTCFYLYLAPVLEKLMKLPEQTKWRKATAACDYSKKPGLTHFLKAWYDGTTVTPLHAQESYRLQSYAQANCLLVLNESADGCKAGEEVQVQLLNGK